METRTQFVLLGDCGSGWLFGPAFRSDGVLEVEVADDPTAQADASPDKGIRKRLLSSSVNEAVPAAII
jgi:hypothetical protein